MKDNFLGNKLLESNKDQNFTPVNRFSSHHGYGIPVKNADTSNLNQPTLTEGSDNHEHAARS